MIIQELQASDYRIRKLIGILGLSLPVILPLTKLEFLASISHYYYDTLSSLLFIIILSAFGLFLISYKGYKKEGKKEGLSDDFLTNIAGLAALIVVFVPTSCTGSTSDIIDALCKTGNLPLFGHEVTVLNTIHLVSAGIFIMCMGWMSRFKFIRTRDESNKRVYRHCGNLVFIAIGLLVVFLILEKLGVNFPLKHYYVYIFETMAIIPFGISWLVKGKAIEELKALRDRMFSKADI